MLSDDIHARFAGDKTGEWHLTETAGDQDKILENERVLTHMRRAAGISDEDNLATVVKISESFLGVRNEQGEPLSDRIIAVAEAILSDPNPSYTPLFVKCARVALKIDPPPDFTPSAQGWHFE